MAQSKFLTLSGLSVFKDNIISIIEENELVTSSALVDLNNQGDNDTFKDPRVQKLLDEGNSWGEMWLKFGQSNYPYDDNFMDVSNYALNNKIKQKTQN